MAARLGSMAYDEELAARVRELIHEHGQAEEKAMFGGLAFLLGGHMAVCVSGNGGLLVRVAAADQAALLDADLVAPMEMGGRVSKTWLRIAPGALSTGRQLETWVQRGSTTALALPPKG